MDVLSDPKGHPRTELSLYRVPPGTLRGTRGSDRDGVDDLSGRKDFPNSLLVEEGPGGYGRRTTSLRLDPFGSCVNPGTGRRSGGVSGNPCSRFGLTVETPLSLQARTRNVRDVECRRVSDLIILIVVLDRRLLTCSRVSGPSRRQVDPKVRYVCYRETSFTITSGVKGPPL